MLKLIHFVHHHHHQVYNCWEEVRRCWASPAAQSLAATSEQRRQTLLSPSLFFSASIFTLHSFAPILILASILNKHKHNTNAAISISLFLPLPPSSHLIAFPLSLPPYSHHILWDKKIGCQPRIFNFLFHIVYNEDHLHLIENEGHFASRTRLLFFGGRNVAWLSKWNG